MASLAGGIWVLSLTALLLSGFASAASRAVVKYTIAVDGEHTPCADHTMNTSCAALYPGICQDIVGSIACPDTCGDCLIDYCQSFEPCQNHGQCTTNGTEYNCTCQSGWSGTNCTDVSDICIVEKPCRNNGTCLSLPGLNYTCRCGDRYSGKNCEQKLTFCDAFKPCHNNGICENLGNGYRCSCHSSWSGVNCTVWEACEKLHPCQNNGTCHNDLSFNDGYVCKCQEQHTGYYCERNKTYCERFPFNPCNNGGKCISKEGSYECQCPAKYIGPRCDIVNLCLPNPCQHDGVCHSYETNLTCSCTDWYTGVTCGTRKTHCQHSSPCQNNGTCHDTADGDFSCTCNGPYTGKTCESHITQAPTTVRATTTTQTRPTTHTALMVAHQTNGTPRHSTQETTHPTIHPTTYPTTNLPHTQPSAAHPTTAPYTLCFPFPCHNGATCHEANVWRFKSPCECRPGFTGTRCETALGICEHSNPCKNSGICHDSGGDFTCTCTAGHTGKTCETRATHPVTTTASSLGICEHFSPCKNNGICHHSGGDFTCTCIAGHTGKTCETPVAIPVTTTASSVCIPVKINEIGCSGQQDVAILFSSHPERRPSELGYYVNIITSLISSTGMHVSAERTHVTVAHFTDTINIVFPLTYDINEVYTKLAPLITNQPPHGGHVALGKALEFAENFFLGPQNAGRANARKVILVILDKADDHEEEIMRVAYRLRNSCITVNIITTFQDKHNKRSLSRFGRHEDLLLPREPDDIVLFGRQPVLPALPDPNSDIFGPDNERTTDKHGETGPLVKAASLFGPSAAHYKSFNGIEDFISKSSSFLESGPHCQ